jgi:uncharacterized protein YbjT (DUF2867 family)
MNPVLVTGATGTIGRELVSALRAAGTPFDVLGSRPAAVDRGVATRVARYEQADELAAAFRGVDTLFVLLPLVPNKLELARHVAAAARTAGVRHVVRASGAGADPASPFALPRLQGQVDDLFASTGVATTFLRNAGFMQNYVGLLGPAVRAGELVAASADAPQSLIDARDIAAVAARVLAAPAAHAGQAYTLTGGEALTDSQRAAIFGRVLGRPVRFTEIPVEVADATMRDAWHLPVPMVEWLGSLNRIVSAGYASGVSPDVERVLGRPPIGFESFVRDHRAAWA